MSLKIKSKTRSKSVKRSSSIKKSKSKSKSISKSNSVKKLPTADKCKKYHKLHFPWNTEKYKEGCTSIGCIYGKRFLGSSCRDPITATKEKLESIGLNNTKKLSLLTQTELEIIIKTNNLAGDKYYNELIKEYSALRHSILEVYATAKDINALLTYDDIELFKLHNNAIHNSKEYHTINDIINFDMLLMVRDMQRINCFYATLGDDIFIYKYNTWYIIKSQLDKCGIYPGNELYDIAARNYRLHNNKPIPSTKIVIKKRRTSRRPSTKIVIKKRKTSRKPVNKIVIKKNSIHHKHHKHNKQNKQKYIIKV